MTPEQRATEIVRKLLECCTIQARMVAGNDFWHIDGFAEGIEATIRAAEADAFRRGAEAAAVKVEEQGRLLKGIFEDSRYDALIGDLAAAIRRLEPQERWRQEALADAFKRGAEAMREAAAKAAYPKTHIMDVGVFHALASVSNYIKAMPLPEMKP